MPIRSFISASTARRIAQMTKARRYLGYIELPKLSSPLGLLLIESSPREGGPLKRRDVVWLCRVPPCQDDLRRYHSTGYYLLHTPDYTYTLPSFARYTPVRHRCLWLQPLLHLRIDAVPCTTQAPALLKYMCMYSISQGVEVCG